MAAHGETETKQEAVDTLGLFQPSVPGLRCLTLLMVLISFLTVIQKKKSPDKMTLTLHAISRLLKNDRTVLPAVVQGSFFVLSVLAKGGDSVADFT